MALDPGGALDNIVLDNILTSSVLTIWGFPKKTRYKRVPLFWGFYSIRGIQRGTVPPFWDIPNIEWRVIGLGFCRTSGLDWVVCVQAPQ